MLPIEFPVSQKKVHVACVVQDYIWKQNVCELPQKCMKATEGVVHSDYARLITPFCLSLPIGTNC